MRIEVQLTLMLVVGIIIGFLVGTFILSCFKLEDEVDELEKSQVNTLKLLKIYNLIHSDFGLYDYELIKKINDIIEGEDNV